MPVRALALSWRNESRPGEIVDEIEETQKYGAGAIGRNGDADQKLSDTKTIRPDIGAGPILQCHTISKRESTKASHDKTKYAVESRC